MGHPAIITTKAGFVLSNVLRNSVMTTNNCVLGSTSVSESRANVTNSNIDFLALPSPTNSCERQISNIMEVPHEIPDLSKSLLPKQVTIDSSSTLSDASTAASQTCLIGPMHFCFIVHGHKGRAMDLSYLHQAICKMASGMNAFDHIGSSEKCVVGAVLSATSFNHHDSTFTKCHSFDASSSIIDAEKERRTKRDRLPLRQKLSLVASRRHMSLSCDDSTKGCLFREDDDNDNMSTKTTIAEKVGNTFIVHNASCNEGKTHDGVINGGERLASEILDVIRHEVRRKKLSIERAPSVVDEPIDVTLSIVGNSLGGLYGRYAVARIAEIAQLPDSELFIKDEGVSKMNLSDVYCIKVENTLIRIHFLVFCTTASPHLGCASHTYFPIPRAAEIGVAYGLGETGRDLFRLNDLLHNMAISSRFLGPLAKFRKRIAYANAFGTDFVVPTTTAAFLDKESNSLHYFDDYFHQKNETLTDDIKQDNNLVGIEIGGVTKNEKMIKEQNTAEGGLVVATFHTPRLSLGNASMADLEEKNDLSVMSSSLDALGWKKVFIDIRKEMPLGISIPTRSISEPSLICPIQKLKSVSQVVESRHLVSAVSSNPSKHTITLPLGHNTICALSRGSVTSALNSGGKPVMDNLALELAKDISSWQKK